MIEQPTAADRTELPVGLVLILLFLAIFLCMLIGQGLMLAYAYMQGIGIEGMLDAMATAETAGERNSVRILTLINHFFTFVVPAVGLSILLARSRWAQYLRLKRQPDLSILLLGVVWIVVAFPLAQYTYWLNQQLPLPDWMMQMEESTNGLIRSFLVMEGPWEFVLSLLVMAVLPAIGEEMIFRGIVQKNIARAVSNPHLAVWIAAVIFSAFHLQFQGFIPRLLLGAILGYLFMWSKNLWVPITAHFMNNGLQVIAAFFMGEELLEMETSDEQQVSVWAALISLLLLLGLGRILHNKRAKEIETTDNT